MAGGLGTRLHPLTLSVAKSNLPVYDKPMIYYPLSVLLNMGLREILIITAPGEQAHFEHLLGDGASIGIEITYLPQESPLGIAQAFVIAKELIAHEKVCLILGDNFFYGEAFHQISLRETALDQGATTFSIVSTNPSQFGVCVFDDEMHLQAIEEKPPVPKSNRIVPGLYLYDNTVVNKAESLIEQHLPLEITQINNLYIQEGRMKNVFLQDVHWYDMGTEDHLLEVANFVRQVQSGQKQQIACIEEIAYRQGWIDFATLMGLGQTLAASKYGQYIVNIRR